MKPDDDRKYIRINKLVLLAVILLAAAVALGWRLGNKSSDSNTKVNNTNQATTVDNANTAAVKSVVTYALPDGWKEASCPAAQGTVYVLPNGSSGVDCGANPSSPVKISIDPGNNTDCNQLQNVQNVKKHVCISLYINGHKTLKATTEFLASSSYKQATTIHAYYVNTGKGIIKVEYIYSSDNGFQAGFDELANSIKVKS